MFPYNSFLVTLLKPHAAFPKLHKTTYMLTCLACLNDYSVLSSSFELSTVLQDIIRVLKSNKAFAGNIRYFLLKLLIIDSTEFIFIHIQINCLALRKMYLWTVCTNRQTFYTSFSTTVKWTAPPQADQGFLFSVVK